MTEIDELFIGRHNAAAAPIVKISIEVIGDYIACPAAGFDI
jgi:hypothetical protein